MKFMMSRRVQLGFYLFLLSILIISAFPVQKLRMEERLRYTRTLLSFSDDHHPEKLSFSSEVYDFQSVERGKEDEKKLWQTLSFENETFKTAVLSMIMFFSLSCFDVSSVNALETNRPMNAGLKGSESYSEKAVDTTSILSTAQSTIDYGSILEKASKKALGGGKAGASAAVVQVCTLMWLRTAMNYQYRYGGNLSSSLKKLYSEGGIPRFYQGLPFAIFQGPLSRFGDTAANVGVLALLESIPETSSLPLPIKTACGSFAAGLWRIVILPIDTSKTAMQVDGGEGLQKLKDKVMQLGPSPLYQGALASAAATTVGHFPWFLTFNFMNDFLPLINKDDDLFLFLVRSAVCGLAASSVSDICSNSLRVIKTTKQTGSITEVESSNDSKPDLSYQEALALILEKDGLSGLFTRGLNTRLLTNAIQSSVFSILWKYFQATQ